MLNQWIQQLIHLMFAEIEIPFIAKDLATGEKLKTLVFENPNTKNKRWDPGEKIVFLNT